MNIVALKPFRYDGRSFMPGFELTVPDKFGRVMIAIGKAKKAITALPVSGQSTESLEAAEENPEKPKRKYKRRDTKTE